MMSGIHFKILRQKQWQIAEIKLEKCWSLLKLGGEYLELYYTIPFTFEYVYNLPSGFLRILL